MKVDWFQRGRTAFSEGRPETITDARISGQDRNNWHKGYQHQQALNNPLTDKDRQEIITFLQDLQTKTTP